MAKVCAVKIYKELIKEGHAPEDYFDVSTKCFIPPRYYPQIAEGMGFDISRAKDIRRFIDAIDLRKCIKIMNKLLEIEHEFDLETGIQSNFTDYTTSGFPWSDLHKICNGMQKQLEHRREIAFKVLFQVVKREVAEKNAELEEKKRKVSIKMTGGGRRKTLAWHRKELAKQKALDSNPPDKPERLMEKKQNV